jgi:tetratricopeptide (TPR) repeat protein
MRRGTLTGCVVGLVCCCVPVARGELTASPQLIDRWIGKLDAADPADRNTSANYLVNFAGKDARSAIIRALPTASPEAAGRLLTILLQTGPWDPRDGGQVARETFTGYAALAADERCARVEGVSGTGCEDVLLRVLTADPSPAVRWSAANGLRLACEKDKAVADRVLALVDAPADPAAYPPAAANAPLLAAAAWFARATDPARADALMARALAVEADQPSAFRGQADFAYLWSADRAADRGDYATALAGFRALAARSAYSIEEVPEAVADLFALHADHGPFAGFDDDVRLYRPYLCRPDMIYCLGRMAGHHGGVVGGPAAEAAVDASALSLGGLSYVAHCQTGMFLLRHNWADLADRELACGLWLSGGQSAAIYLALHAVANERDDDAAAGRYLEGALKRSPSGGMFRTSRYGQTEPWTEADAWGEVHWHYLRAAVTAGDRATALAEAEQVMALDASGQILDHDPGMAADIVPVLADAGQQRRADACFQAAYDNLVAQSNKSPADAMPKNNLAWLCARSDRKMGEADALSAQAVTLEPTDAACLDTRAEVLARLGRPAEALTVEERAIALKPDDLYMRRQIDRFRAAVTASRSTTRPAAGPR